MCDLVATDRFNKNREKLYKKDLSIVDVFGKFDLLLSFSIFTNLNQSYKTIPEDHGDMRNYAAYVTFPWDGTYTGRN